MDSAQKKVSQSGITDNWEEPTEVLTFDLFLACVTALPTCEPGLVELCKVL